MATAHVINGLNGWLAVEIFPVGDATQQPPESEVNMSIPTDDLIARLDPPSWPGRAECLRAMADAKARILEDADRIEKQRIVLSRAHGLLDCWNMQKWRLSQSCREDALCPACLVAADIEALDPKAGKAEAPKMLPLGHEFQAGHPLPTYCCHPISRLRDGFEWCGQPESAHRPTERPLS